MSDVSGRTHHGAGGAGMIRVEFFGMPTIWIGDRPQRSFRSNRVPALLGFLASLPTFATRPTVSEALWPEAPSPDARHRLRQTLLYARALMGPESIVPSGALLKLGEGVRHDREQWRGWIDALASGGSADDAYHLLHRLNAGFLPGFLDPWISDERERLKGEACSAIGQFCERLIVGDPCTALELSERLIALDPFLEQPRTIQVRALLLLDKASLAEQAASEFESLLKLEFDQEPTMEFRRWFRSAEVPPSVATTSEPTLEAAFDCVMELGRFSEAADLLTASSAYLVHRDRAQKTIPWVEALLSTERSNLSQTRRERLELLHADLLRSLGRFTQALEAVDRTLARVIDPVVRARCHLLSSRVQLSLMRLPEAEHNLKLGTLLAKTHELRRELMQANAYLAQIALQNGDFARAERIGLQAARLCREERDPVTESQVCSAVAQAKLRMGKDISNELASVQRCDQLLQEAGIPPGRLERLNIGRIKEQMGDLGAALEAYELGTNSARELGDAFATGIGLTYWGDLLERLDRPAEALVAHREALVCREPLGDVLGTACSLRGAGRAHLKLGSLVEARDALLKSASLFQEVKDVNGFASALLILCLVEGAEGRSEKAIRIGARALNLVARMPPRQAERMGPTFEGVLTLVREIVEAGGQTPLEP